MTAIELEFVVRPPRTSPVSASIPPRHTIALGPALDPDPPTFQDGATLSGLVRARDPTAYDRHRLHRIRSCAGEPQAGVVLRRVSTAHNEYGMTAIDCSSRSTDRLPPEVPRKSRG